MLSTLRLLGAVLVTAACLGPVSLHAQDSRVYLHFQPGAKANAEAAVAAAGGRLHHDFEDLRAIAVSVPRAALAGLRRNPNVVEIEEDPLRELFAQTVPYGIEMVQAPAAVAAGATGAGIKVAVIDSGLHAIHEDFAGVAITGEPDFGEDDPRSWYRDLDSHGTHVTGTIAAADNDLGVVGVSPGDVTIHVVKVFGDTGAWIYSSDLLAAVRRAANKGAKVINMSLGGERPSRTERVGMDALYANGVLLVAAAGNDGDTSTEYPSGYDSVISVAAIDSTKTVASFSQRNAQVELAAPGVAVLSTTSYTDSSVVTVLSTTTEYAANHVEFAARGTLAADLVDGGRALTTNAAWAGKIVLVERGDATFAAKVNNVQLSGGVACILYNNVAEPLFATLGEGNSSSIPAVGLSQADGQALLATAVGQAVQVATTFTQPAHGYSEFNGTSMATPHVSGVAALIWSRYPGAKNTEVRQALQETAEDLGDAGRDNAYGHGLVQAAAALDRLGEIASTSDDVTPPVISAVSSSVTNSKNGRFEISWTTSEPATSAVEINGTLHQTTTLTTTHTMEFREKKGATLTFWVIARDAAGNIGADGPHTHQN